MLITAGSLAALLLASAAFASPAYAQAATNNADTARYEANGTGAKNSDGKKNDPPADSTHPASAKESPNDVYRIGVDDQIEISVWREHDLSLSVVVRPDGMITMPLLNDVPVLGMTPRELADSLTEKLKAFVNEPQVTVSVQQIRSRKVYLVGQVAKQGAYSLNDRKTVLELLSEAGGVGQFAKQGKIYVLRMVDGKEVRIPFHFKKAISGKGGPDDDIMLMPGDKVIVP